MITIREGGSISDEKINKITDDYINDVPVSKIKKDYNIPNKRWPNILTRIYRRTDYKRKVGRPAQEIDSPFITKKENRYSIDKNNKNYGVFFKSEAIYALNILKDIDFDYDEWRRICNKNIPHDELKEWLKKELNHNELTTREISKRVYKEYGKFYNVEYTRRLLKKWSKKEEWLTYTPANNGIPLIWKKVVL